MFKDFIEAWKAVGFRRHDLDRKIAVGLKKVCSATAEALNMISVNPSSNFIETRKLIAIADTLFAEVNRMQFEKAFRKRWWQIGPSCDYEVECWKTHVWIESVRTELKMTQLAFKVWTLKREELPAGHYLEEAVKRPHSEFMQMFSGIPVAEVPVVEE